jgi:uncharacterized membrane protein
MFPLLLRINQVILNPLIALAFAVAFVVFFWGIVQFVRKADDAEGRETGKRNIIYGIIGMVIMVSVFGIIQTVLQTFQIDTTPIQQIR